MKIIRLDTYGAKLVLFVYLLAIGLSYFYTIVYKVYNGDFISKDVLFSNHILLLIAILTALPYLFVYKLYKRYRKKELQDCLPMEFNIMLLRNITWGLLLLSIILLLTGYGQMGTSTGIDGSILSYFRAAVSKLLVRPWVIAFLLLSQKRKNIIITTILFLIQSLLAHSLGGCFQLFLILLLRLGDNFINIVKRYFVFILIILLTFPAIISFAYDFRAQLRENEMSEETKTDIIFGKLCGRISSFSNSAYILQNSLQVAYDSKDIPFFFYFYDTLRFWGYRHEFGSIGSYVETAIKHSKMEYNQTMPGVLGIFAISFIKSPYTFIFNLLYTVFLMLMIFKLVRKIFPNASNIAFLLIIGFCTSGDISELSNSIYTLIIMWFILSLSNKVLWKKRKSVFYIQ
ncbi:hypothetical protein B5F34_10265 [Mediterranea sp. An20]|uniref:oligosaccharide repeat unit polymerase n=1 Tax=Mediterranea sp. An20 TaxID=1965586 RepID=UPI000B389D9A|nr:oligosaccharide repeat unit polymerase [Mediterranea sp. An20]OUP07945.1 hypothetical protein B5F34_10265 [Mediterranea sp. An20]